MLEDIDKFIKAWDASEAAQLLIPSPKSMVLHLGKACGQEASIAYLAWKRNYLERLDYLIKKWDIAVQKSFFLWNNSCGKI